MGAELRHGQRHRDEPGLQRGVERDDVFQALRREDGRTVPRRSAGRDLGGQRLHAAVELETKSSVCGVAGRIDLVVDERVRRRIGLAAGPTPAALRESRHRLLPSGHHPSKSRAPDNN